ncbi:MAG: phenylphosphate carboxylase subunit beta [Proteobacteria bacterium]|nr:phenylphosphate carboxylase subunit beta [Pseudomonadota bacterium]
MPGSEIRDLRDFVRIAEERGELKRVKAEVDCHLELSHIAKINDQKKGPALLFENVKGHSIPVLTGVFTNPTRLAISLEMPTEFTIFDMAKEWATIAEKGTIPPEKVDDGPILENKVEKNIDLSAFPAPHWFPEDGGRYFGTAVYLITKDPETGFVNLGTYRMQILDGTSLGVMFLQGKDADITFRKYREKKEPMPAAAVIGGDPRLFLLGGTSLSYGTGEYDVAGALRKAPVEVIESELTGLPIPAFAEIAVEGYVDTDPNSFRDEGPFGEYPGYYSKGKEKRPWIEVKRILHRANPIFWGSAVGRPPTANTMMHSLAKTAAMWTELKQMGIPGIQSVYFPPASGRFWVVISIKQSYPGHGRQAGLAAFASIAGNYGVKGAIIVDDDIRADDLDGVLWALSVRYNPIEDTEIIKKGRSTPLDPSLPVDARKIVSRILIDATTPYEWEKKPKLVELDGDVLEKVKGRWSELGLEDS